MLNYKQFVKGLICSRKSLPYAIEINFNLVTALSIFLSFKLVHGNGQFPWHTTGQVAYAALHSIEELPKTAQVVNSATWAASQVKLSSSVY